MLWVAEGPWTAEAVLMRFLEAADTDSRLPPVRGPAQPKSSWQEVQRDTWGDANAAEQTRDVKEWSDAYVDREPPSRGAISRLNQVLDWSLAYIGSPNHARALWLFCYARVRGRSASKSWAKVGIKRQTGYRWLSAAVTSLVRSLASNNVLLVNADVDRMRQIGLIPRSLDVESPQMSPAFSRAFGDELPADRPDLRDLDAFPRRARKRRRKRKAGRKARPIATRDRATRDHPFR